VEAYRTLVGNNEIPEQIRLRPLDSMSFQSGVL
jgi:hypothetical protein